MHPPLAAQKNARKCFKLVIMIMITIIVITMMMLIRIIVRIIEQFFQKMTPVATRLLSTSLQVV